MPSKARRLQQTARVVRKAIAVADDQGTSFRELAAHLNDIMGGPRKVMKFICDEANTAKPGSLTRINAAKLFIRIFQLSIEEQGAPPDVGDLTDDDLDHSLLSLLEKTTSKNEKKDDDATTDG